MTESALLTPPLWVEEEGRFTKKGRRSGSFLIQGERYWGPALVGSRDSLGRTESAKG